MKKIKFEDTISSQQLFIEIMAKYSKVMSSSEFIYITNSYGYLRKMIETNGITLDNFNEVMQVYNYYLNKLKQLEKKYKKAKKIESDLPNPKDPEIEVWPNPKGLEKEAWPGYTSGDKNYMKRLTAEGREALNQRNEALKRNSDDLYGRHSR